MLRFEIDYPNKCYELPRDSLQSTLRCYKSHGWSCLDARSSSEEIQREIVRIFLVYGKLFRQEEYINSKKFYHLKLYFKLSKTCEYEWAMAISLFYHFNHDIFMFKCDKYGQFQRIDRDNMPCQEISEKYPIWHVYFIDDKSGNLKIYHCPDVSRRRSHNIIFDK